MRVCFYTLGCKVNLNETGALEQLFRANGFTIAQEGEAADVFIVNSCTVTNFGDQKSRKWLRRKKRENPGAVTVLTGCYPQAFPEEAAQFMEADLVCGNGDRKAILENVQKLLDGHERIVAIAPHQRGEQFEELPVERFETHTRAFIKVEDGCNRQCAYCVIPRARGPVRSRAEESILNELHQQRVNLQNQIRENRKARNKELRLKLKNLMNGDGFKLPQNFTPPTQEPSKQQQTEESAHKRMLGKKLRMRIHNRIEMRKEQLEQLAQRLGSDKNKPNDSQNDNQNDNTEENDHDNR